MFKEFKEFAMKGNVVDMAVGIVIGAAFGAIVNSLVTDIVMPLIGVVTGGLDFSSRYLSAERWNAAGTVRDGRRGEGGGGSTINIGMFISLVLNFLLVAFALFMVVKGMNHSGAHRRRRRLWRRRRPTKNDCSAKFAICLKAGR